MLCRGQKMTSSIGKISDLKRLDFDSITENVYWNTGEQNESRMHRIHAYPAKFPAFITTKAINYAKENSIKTELIADVFCGCGTVALEAKRNNINFWGCDINPVATMIAKTKSQKYDSTRLEEYYDKIINSFHQSKSKFSYEEMNERLKYWYDEKQLSDLNKLKITIEECIPSRSNYRLFFICVFSNILKSTSRWLTKSIKPQFDPKKNPSDVISAFQTQCNFMMSANKESDVISGSKTEIITANFLNPSLKRPKVDLIITSPPYVTSYEYADLHQLSLLWLGYTKDHRELREGSIGSLHHIYNFDRELKRLNDTGSNIVFRLIEKDKAKARSVAKYFLDMQQVARVSYEMLEDKGMALFVIGNTEYKGVRIENARHLCESLIESGFQEICVTKRKITGKILTPYRNNAGKFTTDKNSRKVYSEEFIVIGRKK
jgi:methylase of polypeptide subunit release factors